MYLTFSSSLFISWKVTRNVSVSNNTLVMQIASAAFIKIQTPSLVYREMLLLAQKSLLDLMSLSRERNDLFHDSISPFAGNYNQETNFSKWLI